MTLLALALEDHDLQVKIRARLDVIAASALFIDDARRREQKRDPTAFEERMAALQQRCDAVLAAQDHRVQEAKARIERIRLVTPRAAGT